MSDYNNQEVTAEQQINNEEIVENIEIEEELNTIWNVAMQQLKPKLENDQKFKEIELALESKKKCLLDNAAIKEIEKKITAAKNTKDKAKLRISKLEKRKTNISKKTNNEIEKLEKAKNDYIHTKMQEELAKKVVPVEAPKPVPEIVENQNNNDKKVISEEEKRRRKEKSMATKNKKSSPEYLALEKELRKIEEEEIAQRKLELKKRMEKLEKQKER